MKIPGVILWVATLLWIPVAAAQTAAPAAPPAGPGAFDKPAARPPFPAQAAPAAAAKPSTENEQAAAKAAGEEQSVATIRRRVDEVNVIFTVTDKHGRFIKDLGKENFRVLDDNKPPQSVVEFRRETDLPLRVGLLIDASNSIRDRFRFEQEAASYFLSQIIRPKSDRAFVLGFDTTAEVTQDFTNNTEYMQRGIRMLRPGGGTAMYDAIYFACRDKLLKLAEGHPVRRAIILLSDGNDNQSRVTMAETVEMAQRAEVIIYSISTNASNLRERGDKVLEKLAESTGGRAFFPFKIEDVGNAFAEIQEELRSQYAVAYKPANFLADGRYRSIEIAADNKKYRVRSRKGYFAPRQ